MEGDMNCFFNTFESLINSSMPINKDTIILGIESSCDETSAAVLLNGKIRSNIIAGQKVHEKYGGVVPELASRIHQQNIVPVVEIALREAGVERSDLSAIAFTRGPGLMGSLLVGASFAKSMALALEIPLISVNHMEAHIMAHFIQKETEIKPIPAFPFLCLTVSGGHTQLVMVDGFNKMRVIGETIDDAAGEAFDKSAKLLGLPYPGGPFIDRFAKDGDPNRFKFSQPHLEAYNYSFSGLKTSILYFLKKEIALNPEFIEANKSDLCASIQYTIIEILIKKLVLAIKEQKINQIALAGGVSANSGLRNRMIELGKKMNIEVFIPDFEYCTDNAAMIAMSGHYKYLQKDFVGQDVVPLARMPI